MANWKHLSRKTGLFFFSSLFQVQIYAANNCRLLCKIPQEISPIWQCAMILRSPNNFLWVWLLIHKLNHTLYFQSRPLALWHPVKKSAQLRFELKENAFEKSQIPNGTWWGPNEETLFKRLDLRISPKDSTGDPKRNLSATPYFSEIIN